MQQYAGKPDIGYDWITIILLLPAFREPSSLIILGLIGITLRPPVISGSETSALCQTCVILDIREREVVRVPVFIYDEGSGIFLRYRFCNS